MGLPQGLKTLVQPCCKCSVTPAQSPPSSGVSKTWPGVLALPFLRVGAPKVSRPIVDTAPAPRPGVTFQWRIGTGGRRCARIFSDS